MQNDECRTKAGDTRLLLFLILHSAFPLAVSFCCTFRRLGPGRSAFAGLPGLLRLDVIKHRALCSSDFPRPPRKV